MARSTREEKKTTEEQSIKNQIVWLLMQMDVVVNDIINIKQQITILGEKRSCQHEAIARNSDACRTPPRTKNTARAPRSRSPRTPPTPPTIPPRTTSPLEPLMQLSPLRPRSTLALTPAAVSTLPSLSPLSPLYSVSVTELLELLGPNFDFDLEVERNRYKK
jgi:hypothetical protein